MISCTLLVRIVLKKAIFEEIHGVFDWRIRISHPNYGYIWLHKSDNFFLHDFFDFQKLDFFEFFDFFQKKFFKNFQTFWIWSKMRSKLLNFNLGIGSFCFAAAIVPVSRPVIPHQAGQWRSAPPYRFPLRKSSTPGRNRKRDYATANRTAHLLSYPYIFFPSVLRNNSKWEFFPFTPL